jgi:hypothetical protein
MDEAIAAMSIPNDIVMTRNCHLDDTAFTGLRTML